MDSSTFWYHHLDSDSSWPVVIWLLALLAFTCITVCEFWQFVASRDLTHCSNCIYMYYSLRIVWGRVETSRLHWTPKALILTWATSSKTVSFYVGSLSFCVLKNELPISYLYTRKCIFTEKPPTSNRSPNAVFVVYVVKGCWSTIQNKPDRFAVHNMLLSAEILGEFYCTM